MISFFREKNIEFLCNEPELNVIPRPVPAHKLIPQWFKSIPPEMPERDPLFGSKSFTAKKCWPLLDAMSVGYIIPLFGDVNIRTNHNCSLIGATSGHLGSVVEFHDIKQLGGKTSPSAPGPAVKFINKWIIKTPPGYSTLFIPPINVFEKRFSVLSGLVDTDKYVKEVNFPAVWNIPNFDDVVTAGTPIITAIPIKRSDLKHNFEIRQPTEKENKNKHDIHLTQVSRRGSYFNIFREKR